MVRKKHLSILLRAVVLFLCLLSFKGEKKNTQTLMLGHRVGKKTRKRQKKLDRALQTFKVQQYYASIY